jgi:hypothetical protein
MTMTIPDVMSIFEAFSDMDPEWSAEEAPRTIIAIPNRNQSADLLFMGIHG